MLFSQDLLSLDFGCFICQLIYNGYIVVLRVTRALILLLLFKIKPGVADVFLFPKCKLYIFSG